MSFEAAVFQRLKRHVSTHSSPRFEDLPGVLTRVASLFRRLNINIHSLYCVGQ